MTLYTIAPEASQDLDAISTYFLSRNIETGERWFQKFNSKCQQLLQFPMLGREYLEVRPGVRGIPLEGFVIFYRVKNESIEIMRVVSGRRDLKALFADMDQ